ncbi:MULTISPECIES: tail fiber assembly protein [Enterobacter cloacae complex]|uniref:tail fiber assembly protein n=1 Tax=Enterobacter cloacae complex TaxID=354276 RepID=UPI00075D0DE1|nr:MULTISPECIES: tail fiber assembly protein [Enterobacter cloacae complex]ELB7803821.1 tail fiber assembly protein [Enterobacter hormaechei]ELC6425712.1 tail fiber assembly protein [Enterobacter hormaechei]KVI83957.1 phage tail protein [Enterobacter hormaechei subsp. xiangfangensis]MBT1760689.1 tail fiber assembly protein [Enterobacter hormaechei subsp. xiangfangensis]MBT1770023.1 tail fiber assembly protein [Enterobacter hormaechei subsp. xiangfangensis]
MTFKFSDKDRTIRIYNLRADTREFIGAGDAYIPAGTGLPADCTDIAPPDIAPGMAAVFNGKKWSLYEDHRNDTVYSKKNGQQIFITGLGELPSDVTTIAPEGDYMRWDDNKWIKDSDAERAAAVSHAIEEKKQLQKAATEIINTLQDAVDLDMATEKEIVLLSEWKAFRVLLNRVDTSKAPEIEWPEVPDNVA